MNRDEKYMKRAIGLAARARGAVSPNPMVGAVVVRADRIVGQGYHHRAGEAHGEVLALDMAGELARGAELFLNLEPCSHFGRTPPCAPRVIASGVRRVVVGMVDPNPKVSGRGIEAIRAAGIEVEVGTLGEECKKLNEIFIHWITKNRPFVILKAAMSLDGKIATRLGNSQWITSEASRRDAHRIRAEVDAIIVGAGTVRADDPSLTAREAGAKKQPLPVVLTSRMDLPPDAKVFKHPAGCVVAASQKSASSKRKELAAKGVKILTLPLKKGLIDWDALFGELASMRITSCLIEGGGEVFGSAIEAGVVNKITAYIAPMIIGGDTAPGAFRGAGAGMLEDAARLQDVTINKVGCDFKITGYF